ncbi:osteocalcin [Protopterus annectens]|uniref:osteocalcin n=1 Tax=Protopterus annectens TaxID=7888 RepID=UPI001CF9E849|nr:osteocalcin [Protopterus annectens]
MRTLFLLTLCALAVICFCKRDADSSHSAQDSHGSQSREAVVVRKKTANAFMKRHKRSYYDYVERYYEQFKTPQERQREICEHYQPCDQMADQVGADEAYRRYFGGHYYY